MTVTVQAASPLPTPTPPEPAALVPHFGTVLWFNEPKGFGFIRPEAPTRRDGDAFVMYSSLLMDGYKFLKADQRVAYDLSDTIKGAVALHVEPVGPDGSTPRRDALGLPRPGSVPVGGA